MEGSGAAVGRQGGPYLQVACVCEKVLHEQDGVLSAIRMVDRFTLGAVAPDAPDEMPSLPVGFTLLVVLKAGGARGRFGVHVTMEAPSGERLPNELTLPFLLEGEDRGVNLVIPVQIQVDQEGLYWFDVFLQDPLARDREEELLTRVPVRIIYQPQRLVPGPSGPPPM